MAVRLLPPPRSNACEDLRKLPLCGSFFAVPPKGSPARLTLDGALFDLLASGFICLYGSGIVLVGIGFFIIIVYVIHQIAHIVLNCALFMGAADLNMRQGSSGPLLKRGAFSLGEVSGIGLFKQSGFQPSFLP